LKDDRLHLIHIRECLQRIELYTAEGRKHFLADPKTQDAVLRNLHTLPESTQRLSKELKDAHPEVEWRSISGFRNVLVHDYLGINLELVWRVIEQDIPTLKTHMRQIIHEHGIEG